MSNLPGAPMSMPTAAVEAGVSTESGSSGIEKSVEAAISSGNTPALIQAGTQITQAATQSIAAIAAADPNEANLPEQGVIGAIAGQANGLAQEAHRQYVNSINEILKASEPAPIPEPIPVVAPLAPPTSMPGFESVRPPEPPAPTVSTAPEAIIAPPTVEIHPIAIAAQAYLDERDATDRILNASQVNYEGHSIRTAVPYYEAVLAQDPSDQQWQAFVTALKLESLFYETKLKRANLALQINQLQNLIEDNRNHNILPTAEQAETLKNLQMAFDKANEDVERLEQDKKNAEDQYHATN